MSRCDNPVRVYGRNRARLTIGVAATALLLFFPGALVQVGVILSGGAIGWWLYRKTIPHSEHAGPADWRHHLVAGGILALFFLLLILLPVLASTTGRNDIAVFDSF